MLNFLLTTVASTFLGIIIGVFFEEPITLFKTHLIQQGKRLILHKSKYIKVPETFAFGKQFTNCLIIDGDGEVEYTYKTIITHFDARQNELPQDLVVRREQIQEREEEKRQKGLPYFWNGERYCLDKYVISRYGQEEHLQLELWFRPSDYYTFLATNMSLDNEHLRHTYIGNADLSLPIQYFSNSFAVYIAVITSDKYIIIPKRSATQVGAGQGLYNMSVSEGLSRPLDRGVLNAAPDMYRCAVRGIIEELGLREPENFKSSDITFLSFGIETRYLHWGLLGLTHVDCSAEEIKQRRSTGVKDKWENTELHIVRFDPDTLIPFIFSHGPWSSMALACFYHALVHEFRRSNVDRIIKKNRNNIALIESPVQPS